MAPWALAQRRVLRQGGQVVGGVAAGRGLRAQAQQAQVTGLVRTEAGDLDIVADQAGGLGDGVFGTGEELLLLFEARTPGEGGADFEILADGVDDHVEGIDAASRVGVVGAAGVAAVDLDDPVVEFEPAQECIGHCEWIWASIHL